ncbi:putative RNA-directed DNA polymerase [Tanacetum coccineum]
MVRSINDRLNSQVNVKEMNEFNDFINDARLVEIPMGGIKFTRVSDNGLKFSKLDRFLMNDDFIKLWGNPSVIELDRKLSDHCLIVLKDVDLDFGPKPFRIFNIWMDEADFRHVVEEAWKKEIWGHKEKREVLKNEAMKWELEAEKRTLNEDERAAWLEARKQWEVKENEYSNMLRQKARFRWDVEVIKVEVARHYRALFSEGVVLRPIFCCSKIEKISIEDARLLEMRFNEKEVWDAIHGCGGDKAPGPDGFNFKFIRKFWDIIKSNLIEAVMWFWEKMEISRWCNASFVTIIPKVSDPIGLGDFRPISLIGCYYKIIAKVLAERVKRVVGNVVGDVQNAFIKGRYILDGVLIANETMEYLKKKRERGLIFKVDFEKAYDSINWKFLLNIMKRMGNLGLRGVLGKVIPYHLLLFILAAEGLNAIVNEAVEKGIFRGVKVGEDRVTVSHLQYADDTIFFGEWNKENAKALMCILKCFEEVSELRVNYNKSKLYGIGVNDEELVDMARWMGCGIGEFTFTYLGLPIGENMGRINAWNIVVEKFKSRLANWKAKTMSFGGRLTLVKSVLGSLPLYYFSMFRVPLSVIKQLERIRKNFFWGGVGEGSKLPWVKWDTVIASYGSGVKYWVTKGKKFSVTWKMGAGGVVKGRGVWRDIVRVGEEIEGLGVGFVSSCVGVLGDGRDIRFWLDRWVDDGRLCDRFSRLYHLDRSNKSSVMEKGVWVNGEWCWVWDWVRNIRGRVSKDFEELLGVLQNMVVSNNCRDRWRWTIFEDSKFTVKVLSSMVEEKILQIESGARETIWNKLVPKKVNIFVWRALKGRLPVRGELDKRGIDLDSVLCLSCTNAVESCAHSLITCDLAMSVWDKVFSWWKMGSVNAFSIGEFFSTCGNVNVPSNFSRVWQAVIWTSGYYIWKERNARVFGNKVSSTNKIVQDIQLKSYEWIVRRSNKFKEMDWQIWLRDPIKCRLQ